MTAEPPPAASPMFILFSQYSPRPIFGVYRSRALAEAARSAQRDYLHLVCVPLDAPPMKV